MEKLSKYNIVDWNFQPSVLYYTSFGLSNQSMFQFYGGLYIEYLGGLHTIEILSRIIYRFSTIRSKVKDFFHSM